MFLFDGGGGGGGSDGRGGRWSSTTATAAAVMSDTNNNNSSSNNNNEDNNNNYNHTNANNNSVYGSENNDYSRSNILANSSSNTSSSRSNFASSEVLPADGGRSSSQASVIMTSQQRLVTSQQRLVTSQQRLVTSQQRPMTSQSVLAVVAVLLVLVTGTAFEGANAEGTYSVLAPSVLRPNRDYSVVLSAHNTLAPLRLGVEVTGNLRGGGASGAAAQEPAFQMRQEAILQTDSSQLVKFQMGDLNSGDYYLSVSGTGGGLEFRNITALKFEPKSYSVFIETDRAIYKPGDVVKFRVLVVNPNLRPTVTGAIDVHVEDGSGVPVKQFPRVFTNKGTWSSELQLSTEPVLGQWGIVVTVLGQENRGGFMVAEYVEPKFEVSVQLPEQLSLEDEQLTVTVTANYPYGRPIRGEVTVQVTPRYAYHYLQAPYDAPVSVVRPLKGRADILLRLKEDLGLGGDYSRTLEVTAYVKEELTERVQNSTASVTVYRFPYTMTFLRSSDTFKPGLKYTAYLQVSHQDGRPITSGQVTVRHAFVRDEAAFVTTTHTIPPTGLVTLAVYPPLERPGPTWTLALEAQYEQLTQWLGEVPRAHSPAGAFLQATLLTEQPTVGQEVVVALNSTEPLVYFVYEVLARGDVLHATTLQAHQGNTHTFRFIASGTMFPRARLLVYYVRPDGEVVADSLHFAVQRSPEDKVTLSVTPSRVDVGGEDDSRRVSISVSARPNSLIGVAAMDKRSLAIMGSQYRMDKSDIIAELESYDPGHSLLHSSAAAAAAGGSTNLQRRRVRSTGSSSSSSSDSSSSDSRSSSDSSSRSSRSRRALRPEMAFVGTATAQDVFENAGVVVMTNANIVQRSPLESGAFLPGAGPIDGRGWDPSNQPPAHNGPFGRLSQSYRPETNTLRPDLGPGLEYNAPPRPPLAGPYAFSFLPPPPDAKPRIYLSQLLPETWLFTHRQTGLNGILAWQEQLPRTLADYTLVAFAVDDFNGLTIAEQPAQVAAHRPFHLSMRVPASVVRGEAVAVELELLNHGPSNISAVTVTIDNQDGSFLFPDFGNEIEEGSPAASKSRVVGVAAASGSSLSFMVVPQQLGPVTVRATATGGGHSDTNTQTLTVKAEGHRLHVNKALFFAPPSSPPPPPFTRTLNISLPRNIVRDSLSIQVSAMGDVLGGAASSLQQLVSLPTGCGEQNMATMLPIIITLQHLKRVGALSRSLQERAVQQLELRFQQQLTYRQQDGSFADFDEYREARGNTWLTAFVAKSLRHAAAHIAVPRSVITRALAWLVKQQQPDGSFADGRTRRSPPPAAGSGAAGAAAAGAGATAGAGAGAGATDAAGAGNFSSSRESPLALTSFVLLAILEVEDYSSAAVRNAGNRALEYIWSVLQQQDPKQDPFGLAIATYALHVADHPFRDTAFYEFEALATVQDDEKWWSSGKPSVSTEEGNIVSSLDIEQTAYGLLTYCLRSLAVDSGPVARWLVQRRNAKGGFSSTQDTAVGLSALSALSELLSAQQQPAAGQLTVRLVYGERGHRFIVNAANARTVQRLELPPDTRSVELSGTGAHVAIVQLSYAYNVHVTAPRPAFSLDPQLDRTTDANRLRLTACTALLVRDNTSAPVSNMAVMEVMLPSGYVIDNDALPGLYDYPGVKRVERLRQSAAAAADAGSSSSSTRPQSDIERGVAIYFDQLSASEVCPTVTASRVNRVAFQKPAVVKVYDYYDLTRQARQFYDAAPATLCDICDLGECEPAACDVQIVALNRQRQDPEDIGYPATIVETSGSSGLLTNPAVTAIATITMMMLVARM